jgi:hypothetical protein
VQPVKIQRVIAVKLPQLIRRNAGEAVVEKSRPSG